MIAFLITEAELDAQILSKVLPAELSKDVQIMIGDGIAGTQSKARSLVVTSPWPVAMVVDADSSEPEAVRARRDSLKEVVGSVAGRTPFSVFVAAPQLPIIFFQAPSILMRLYPDLATKPYILEVAEDSVNAAMKQLDPTKKPSDIYNAILREIRADDLPLLHKTPLVSELIGFLENCRAHRVMIRIEIGPGVPINISPLQSGDGFKALLTLLVEILTAKVLTTNVSTATSGDVTVQFEHRRFQVGSVEPAGDLPSTHFLQLEGSAKILESKREMSNP